MNKTESALMGLLAGVLIFLFCIVVFWYLILDNFIDVVAQFHYDLKPVRAQMFWLWLGWCLIGSVTGAIKIYHYSRRGKDTNG